MSRHTKSFERVSALAMLIGLTAGGLICEMQNDAPGCPALCASVLALAILMMLHRLVYRVNPVLRSGGVRLETVEVLGGSIFCGALLAIILEMFGRVLEAELMLAMLEVCVVGALLMLRRRTEFAESISQTLRHETVTLFIVFWILLVSMLPAVNNIVVESLVIGSLTTCHCWYVTDCWY